MTDRDTLRAKLTQHRNAAATELKSFPESDYIRGTVDTWDYVLRLMNEGVLDALCPSTPESSEPSVDVPSGWLFDHKTLDTRPAETPQPLAASERAEQKQMRERADRAEAERDALKAELDNRDFETKYQS